MFAQSVTDVKFHSKAIAHWYGKNNPFLSVGKSELLIYIHDIQYLLSAKIKPGKALRRQQNHEAAFAGCEISSFWISLLLKCQLCDKKEKLAHSSQYNCKCYKYM